MQHEVADLLIAWRDRELVDAADHDRAGAMPVAVIASAASVGLAEIAADPDAGPVAARVLGATGLGHAVALVVAPAAGGTVTMRGMVLGDAPEPRTDLPEWLGLRVARPRPIEGQDDAALDDRVASLLLHAAAGLADRLVELSSAYATDRTAFGRSIRSFQTVAHRLVDLAAAAAEINALAAGTDVGTSCLVAALDRLWSLVDGAVQVHGGMGYAEEHEVARHWRDVRMLRLLVDPGPRPTSEPATSVRRSRQPSSARLEARQVVTDLLSDDVDDWERTREWPRELFRRVGATGWLGTQFPASMGGRGLGIAEQAVWIEELVRCGSGGLAADLGASIDLAALYVQRAGDEAQHERWLRGLVSGELIGALGITEPGTGSDVAGITTRARRDTGDWVLDGAKIFITNGPWADVIVTAAKVAPEDGGGASAHGQITLFAVPGDADGLTRRRLSMLGWHASHTGELFYDEVRVGDEARLGDVGSGFGWIVQNFAWERYTLAAGAVVLAELTLGEFPDSRRGDAWATLDRRTAAARALVDHALDLTISDPHDARTLQVVALAKLQTQSLAVDVADLALATVGVAGARMDHLAQRRLRDARLGPIGGGTDAIMREIVAKLMT